MKLIWKGKVFGPTGIATAGREMVKALTKLGYEIQCEDIWHDLYDFNKGLEFLNKPINAKETKGTIYFDYPHNFKDGYGTLFGGSVHEGTKLFDGWADNMNKMDVVWCPSNAVKNLFKWNGVERKIYVIPHGFNPDIYKPIQQREEIFTFLSVNSWSGDVGDRKGTEILIKAFDEEFKQEEKVRLLIKFGTFWMKPFDTGARIRQLLGHDNPNILVNQEYVGEEELAQYYQNADCFVAPTRGEGFGLTILNSLACACPVIVTKDVNAGHMDFCKKNPGVLWIDAPEIRQGDPKFYCQGNMLAEPDINSVKKQMRWAYENRDKLREMGKSGAEFVKDWTWDNAAKKMDEMIKEVLNEKR